MTDALEQSLRRHVRRLAGDIGERHVWRPAALRAAEAFIGEELLALGYEVARQTYIVRGVESGERVIRFPWQLSILSRMGAAVPRALYDRSCAHLDFP